MDHEAFQTDSQTTLIAVCFVSPRLAFWVSRQTSESVFKTKKELVSPLARLVLGRAGNRALFPSFYPPPPTTSFDLGSRKVLGLAGFARLNPAAILIHGVFPLL